MADLTWWCIFVHLTTRPSTDGKRAPLTASGRQPQGSPAHIYRKDVVNKRLGKNVIFSQNHTETNSDDGAITKKTTRTIKHENFSKMNILKFDMSSILKSYIIPLRPGCRLTQIKARIYDCIHCFMCNGINCWLSIVDAFNFNVWFRACMCNYTPLFYNEVILIHVLTPVLGWKISVKEIPLDAFLENFVRKTSAKHGSTQDYFRPDHLTTYSNRRRASWW